jgi:hypothetical protein
MTNENMTNEDRTTIRKHAPPLIQDYWVRVSYFDVPGLKSGVTYMNFSDIFEWLENNPGTLIGGVERV